MTIKKLTMMLAPFLPIWGMLWRYKRRKRAVIASPVLPVSLVCVFSVCPELHHDVLQVNSINKLVTIISVMRRTS